MIARRGGEWAAWGLALAILASPLSAQEEPPPADPAQEPRADFQARFLESVVVEGSDYREARYAGGFRLLWPEIGVEIVGQSALVLLDRDESMAEVERQRSSSKGLPRRTLADPASRRKVGPELMRQRLRSFLRAAGQPGTWQPSEAEQVTFDLWRYLYVEGGVTVIQDDVEVVHAERLFISPLDNRMVIEGAELRYITRDRAGMERVFTVRGDRIVKQGPRFSGRDLVITSCTAGEPHFALHSGDAEIIERGDEFEIVTRGNRLAFSGVEVLPLPAARFFTKDQSQFPIKGASAGYSSKERVQLGLEFGGPLNKIGGSVHEFLTGRPADEFRGDWLLGVGYNQKRGFPLDAAIDYRGGDLYFGKTDAFFLQDQGDNIREITRNLDGTLIDNESRRLFRTKNRIRWNQGTSLDLTLFKTSDAAVYSEFFRGDYHSQELPETSVFLRHGVDNMLLTANGRWNLDDYSYRDNRALADAFTEEVPVATFDLYGQQVATTPWDTPVLIDAATTVGTQRSNYDDTVVGGVDDERFRFDQLLELSMPFRILDHGIRPFARVRYTYFSETVARDSDDRWASAAGVRGGTRVSRTWRWRNEDGEAQTLRHVVAPLITYAYLFQVTDDPTEYYQFDRIDSLDEQALIRVELRNLLQDIDESRVHDIVMLDLVQNVFPISGRDNNGERLGLFEYELVVFPEDDWLPVPGLALLVEGEHDWREGMRTFDGAVRFGKVLGMNWFAEYRTDYAVDGTVGFGTSTDLLSRWQAGVRTQYDLDRDDFLNYALNLTRIDHDWRIMFGIRYDVISDNTSVIVEFQPMLGGLVKSRRQDEWLGTRLDGRTVPVWM